MSWRREIRRNDFVCQLVVEPGELQVGKQTRLFGVPFGSTARIILLFLQSEALRNNSREVELGPSLGAWLQRLDIPHGGKSYRLVREQLLRISACSLRFMWGGHDESGQPLSGFKKDAIIQEGVLMLGPDDAERQHMLWQDRIVVGESFFRALKERPVPINLNAVRAIMHSSRATDIYVWLTYRCFRLERPVKISWQALKEQFGDPQHRLDRFRDRFMDALKLALTAYPECQTTVDTRKGLTIFPSPPAVPERRYLQLVPLGLPAPKPAPAPSTCRPKIAKGGMPPALRGSGGTADLSPDRKGSLPGSSIPGGGNVLTVEREEVVDLVVRREEPLRLAGGFEPLHLPLASSRRLARILGPVVEPFVAAVLDPGHQFFLRRGIARQLVRDQHPRRPHLLLQELAQQALGRLLVAPALHQHVEHEAVLVDRPPQPVLLAGDGDHHLVEVPFVAGVRQPPTDLVGERLAELAGPLPHRFMADDDPAGGQHLLDHAQAEREAEVEPDHVADDLGWEPVAGVAGAEGHGHPARLPAPACHRKPAAGNLTVPLPLFAALSPSGQTRPA
jgi:hypothetical protein